MINLVVFRSEDELTAYIDGYWAEVDLSDKPVKYPCAGVVLMCPDESYDMRFLYAEDVRMLADAIGV